MCVRVCVRACVRVCVSVSRESRDRDIFIASYCLMFVFILLAHCIHNKYFIMVINLRCFLNKMLLKTTEVKPIETSHIHSCGLY